MDRIGLVETIAALRAELTAALEQAEGEAIQFPITGMELELHVGVTREDSARGGLRFWVLELGASGGVVREQVQRITVSLGAPVIDGEGVAVRRDMDVRP